MGYEAKETPLTFKVRVEANGKSVELSVPTLKNEEEQQYVGILKDLVANWVFPMEADTVGNYQAWFAPITVEGNFAHLQKRKVAYNKASLAQGKSQVKTLTPEIVSSNHLLDWDLKISMPGTLHGEEAPR